MFEAIRETAAACPSGPLRWLTVIEHDGAQSGIQLQLSPLGARALFGMPAGELASIDLHATDVMGRSQANCASDCTTRPPGLRDSRCSTGTSDGRWT